MLARRCNAALSPVLCLPRTLAGVNDSSSAAFESRNLGYLVGVGALIAVGAAILSAISKEGSSVPSIKETQQELGRFLH